VLLIQRLVTAALIKGKENRRGEKLPREYGKNCHRGSRDSSHRRKKSATAICERRASQWTDLRIGRFLATEKATGEKIGWCGFKKTSQGVEQGHEVLFFGLKRGKFRS